MKVTECLFERIIKNEVILDDKQFGSDQEKKSLTSTCQTDARKINKQNP